MELEKHHFEAIAIITESAEKQEMPNPVSESLMKNKIFFHSIKRSHILLANYMWKDYFTAD